MKTKMVEVKKKRAPGAGRKPVDDKIKMIPLYIRTSLIDTIGGEKNIQFIVKTYLENYFTI